MKGKLLFSTTVSILLSCQLAMGSYNLFHGDPAKVNDTLNKVSISDISEYQAKENGVEMHINGGPFSAGSMVVFGGQPLATRDYVSEGLDSTLIAEFPVGQPGESVSVQVFDTEGEIKAGSTFTYPQPASVTSIGEGIPDGNGSRFFEIAGSNFDTSTRFYIDGVSVTVHYGSQNQGLPNRVVAEVDAEMPEGIIEIHARNSPWDSFYGDTVSLEYRYQQQGPVLPDYYWQYDNNTTFASIGALCNYFITLSEVTVFNNINQIADNEARCLYDWYNIDPAEENALHMGIRETKSFYRQTCDEQSPHYWSSDGACHDTQS